VLSREVDLLSYYEGVMRKNEFLEMRDVLRWTIHRGVSGLGEKHPRFPWFGRMIEGVEKKRLSYH